MNEWMNLILRLIYLNVVVVLFFHLNQPDLEIKCHTQISMYWKWVWNPDPRAPFCFLPVSLPIPCCTSVADIFDSLRNPEVPLCLCFFRRQNYINEKNNSSLVPTNSHTELKDLTISCRHFSKLISSWNHFSLTKVKRKQSNLNSFTAVSGEFWRFLENSGEEGKPHWKGKGSRQEFKFWVPDKCLWGPLCTAHPLEMPIHALSGTSLFLLLSSLGEPKELDMPQRRVCFPPEPLFFRSLSHLTSWSPLVPGIGRSCNKVGWD